VDRPLWECRMAAVGMPQSGTAAEDVEMVEDTTAEVKIQVDEPDESRSQGFMALLLSSDTHYESSTSERSVVFEDYVLKSEQHETDESFDYGC